MRILVLMIGSVAVKVRKKLAVETRLLFIPERVTLLTVASWLRVTMVAMMTTSSADVGIEPPVQVAAVCQREPGIDTEVICAAYDCGENNRVKIIAVTTR